MNDVVIGDVQTYKVKPRQVKAIQFTGKNGREIVEFVKEHDPEVYIRNGGKYLTFVGRDEVKYTVRKTDFLVYSEFSEVVYYDEPSFRWRHSVSTLHKVM